MLRSRYKLFSSCASSLQDIPFFPQCCFCGCHGHRASCLTVLKNDCSTIINSDCSGKCGRAALPSHFRSQVVRKRKRTHKTCGCNPRSRPQIPKYRSCFDRSVWSGGGHSTTVCCVIAVFFTGIFNGGLLCVITQMEVWSASLKSLSGTREVYSWKKWTNVCCASWILYGWDSGSCFCRANSAFIPCMRACYDPETSSAETKNSSWFDSVFLPIFQGSVWALWSESMRPSPISTSSILASQERSSCECWSLSSSRSSFQAW